MDITIRQEKQADFNQIYDLVKTAFQTAKVSDGNEQDFVNELRKNENYIKELALVAEKDNKLIGHIMLTENHIINDNSKFKTLLLAPISVVLEYRNRGIGSMLINQSFKLARNMGYKSVILVGDPAYYNRFGFRKSADLGITNSNGIQEEYVLVCELIPRALKKVSGEIHF